MSKITKNYVKSYIKMQEVIESHEFQAGMINGRPAMILLYGELDQAIIPQLKIHDSVLLENGNVSASLILKKEGHNCKVGACILM